jgi:hypothetical protein
LLVDEEGLLVGEGAGSGVAPDLKYEQPATARATRRIPERII